MSVKNSSHLAIVVAGDLIQLLDPFRTGDDMLGIVLSYDAKYMTVYHASIKKNIIWNRHVNCIVSRL